MVFGRGDDMDGKPNYEALIEDSRRLTRLINVVPCVIYDYVLWPDGQGKFIYISPQCEKIFEYDANRILDTPGLLWSMVHPEDIGRLQQEDAESNAAGVLFESEVRIICPSGKLKWIQLTSMPSVQKFDSQTLWSGVILDITDRKQVEEERNRLINELQTALAEVRTLSGFIPICSNCKMIRDDKGYWERIEKYIGDRSDAQFSHSICPRCARELYPDLDHGP